MINSILHPPSDASNHHTCSKNKNWELKCLRWFSNSMMKRKSAERQSFGNISQSQGGGRRKRGWRGWKFWQIGFDERWQLVIIWIHLWNFVIQFVKGRRACAYLYNSICLRIKTFSRSSETFLRHFNFERFTRQVAF